MKLKRINNLITALINDFENLNTEQKELLNELIALKKLVPSDEEIEIRESLSYARSVCKSCGRPF